MNNFSVPQYLVNRIQFNFFKQFCKYVGRKSCATHMGKKILTLDSMFLDKYFLSVFKLPEILKKEIRRHKNDMKM